MDEMPVIGVPIAARVLAHGRDEHAISKRHISNRERIKKMSHNEELTPPIEIAGWLGDFFADRNEPGVNVDLALAQKTAAPV